MKKTIALFISIIVLIGCNKDEATESPTNSAPTCIILTPANGQEITKGTTVTISVDAEDSDGTITEVRFYVDGVGKGSALNFPYNYNWETDNENLGSHTIQATSYDNNNNKSSDEISVQIIQASGAPNADFIADPLSGSPPLNVNFEDQSTNTPTSWQWSFGDGGSSTQQNPTHTYNSNGTYTVSLTVSNNHGSETKTKSDYIVIGNSNCPSTFTDARDNQVYSAVQIGSQCWMVENLAYLPSVSPSSAGSQTTPYYYVYDYQGTNVNAAKATSNYQTYGVLYNWPAAMAGDASSNSVPSGVQGICPNGWHLPGDEEWKILEGEVDSQYGYPDSEWDDSFWRGLDAGGSLKEMGTTHWSSPNTGATNSSGFTALPAGFCGSSGTYYGLDDYLYVWSSTQDGNTDAWFRSLHSGGAEVYRSSNLKDNGFSVRCTKD